MPNIAVLDMTGAKVGTIELKDSIFGIEPNAVVMHMAVVNYLANQRQGTQSTLTRTEVSGGGRKPWRQKGTGHARQVQPALPNGDTVALPWVRSREIIPTLSIRRLDRLLLNLLCLTRFLMSHLSFLMSSNLKLTRPEQL